MTLLNSIIAKFPFGMACLGLGLVVLLFILFIVRTLQKVGKETDQDK